MEEEDINNPTIGRTNPTTKTETMEPLKDIAQEWVDHQVVPETETG